MTREGVDLVTSQYSPRTFLVLCVWGSLFTLGTLIDFIKTSQIHDASSRSWILLFVALVFRSASVAFLWVIWYYKKRSDQSDFGRKPLVWFTENIYHVLIVLSISVNIIAEVLAGPCDGDSHLTAKVQVCNKFDDTGSINPTDLTALMFIPMLAFFLIRDLRVDTFAITWLISIGTLVFCAVYQNSTVIVVPIVAYAVMTILIFHDAKRQHDTMVGLVAALQYAAIENEKLQEEARATELRAMIGNVAHDLKTPLTSIISGIECIQDALTRVQARPRSDGTTSADRAPGAPEDPCESVRACLTGMLGTTSFMTMCINRCLDYTKASKGVKLVPRPETVCLRELVDFPVKIMRDVQTQVAISVAPVAADICSHIITDKQWLMENLLCLLSNAVRYSQQGSVDIRIAHHKTEKNVKDLSTGPEPLLRFEVWDTGIGLTSEAMSALFAPFKQAQRLAGGTGLGLFSLAKRVEALHGEYGVSARPDGIPGSLFWFSIPYRPDEMSASVDATPAPDTAYNSPDGSASFLPAIASPRTGRVARSHKEVLVVDDAPSILKMTTMLLTKKGHHVEQATNGAVALEKIITALSTASAQRYDVVLMDLQMPVMDGAEAIRRVRAYERSCFRSEKTTETDLESGSRVRPLVPHLRRQLIIALSANSDSETIQEALDAGADHFMSKPFTYDDFCETMIKSLRSADRK